MQLPPIKSGPPVSSSGIDCCVPPIHIPSSTIPFRGTIDPQQSLLVSCHLWACRELSLSPEYTVGLTNSLSPDVQHLNYIS